ncbi:MAG: FAD/NAD(P)-binding protein, partial [Devosia sp.]|nr:FAD/NAD(P)-binding protein [Devosia sp.]
MNEAHLRLSILIVGGGASGVLLAAHLLRSAADIRVTLVEKRPSLGRGVAYSTRQLDHVLNVAAPGMSAFADDPDHFWRWLRDRQLVTEAKRFVFVPRRHYGSYLADVLAEVEAATPGRL